MLILSGICIPIKLCLQLFHTVEKGRDKEGIRQNPCRRACETCAGKSKGRNQEKRNTGTAEHLTDAGKHGKSGIAQPLDGKANRVDKT